MEISDLRVFLSNFGIAREDIEEYISGKELVEDGSCVYLCSGSPSSEDMVFIKLRKKLPSKYILRFVEEKSKNILVLESDKKALDFTYGNDLSIDSVKGKCDEEKYYLIQYGGEVLGYCEREGKKLFNRMNIGEYLRE